MAASQIVEELSGKKPKVPGRWYVGENRDQFILVRSGLGMRLYVVDKASRQMLANRRMGFLESIRQRIRLR